MADFATTVPVAQALWPAAEGFLNQDLLWQATPGNRLQELVVGLKDPSLALAKTLTEKQLASSASNVVAVVNEFLKAQGFSLQLRDAGVSRMIYAAAVMKLLGNWVHGGQTDYHLNDIEKPGFRLPGDGLKHFVYQGQTVVVVPTDGGFSFLVTRPTGASGFSMLNDWQTILHGMKPTTGNGLILPMADIGETKVDVSALEGMTTVDLWKVQEAIMAAKFGLTPRHVKFEAAFAFSAKSFGISDGNEPKAGDYVADHALYFSMVKTGHWLPLAAGLVPVVELSDKDLM